jgi:hypothetical protein
VTSACALKIRRLAASLSTVGACVVLGKTSRP